MQPLLDKSIKYKWNAVTPQQFSLKNSYTISWQGKNYMFATDMLVGGVRILEGTNTNVFNDYMLCFHGYTMMWNPFPYIVGDTVFVLVCDTAGGHPFWEHQRLYYFTVNRNVPC